MAQPVRTRINEMTAIRVSVRCMNQLLLVVLDDPVLPGPAVWYRILGRGVTRGLLPR